KSRAAAGEALPFQADPLPLRALYFLGAGDAAAPRIDPLTKREALARLINHSFFLDGSDRERMQQLFAALTEVANAVPSFDLDYPREYDRLPDVIVAVTGHDAMREHYL